MQYKPFSSFVFRCPSLSLTNINNVLYDKDSLMNYLSLPNIQEAIYIASPVLCDEVRKLLLGKITDRQNIDRILSSCVRYIERMSTRCTPFGLFAGCGVGELSNESDILLEKLIKKNIRLDMYFLSTLYDRIIGIQEIKNKIKYFPNNSLYKVGKKLRYIETLYENNKRKYQIAEIEKSLYLNKLLKASANGTTIELLKTTLISEQITEQEAIDFICELIDAKVLVPELNQSLAGDDFLSRFIRLLEQLNLTDQTLLSKLNEIQNLLLTIEQSISDLNLYEKIIEIIKSINIPYEEKTLFQIDIEQKKLKATLGSDIINELESALIFLNKITPNSGISELDNFKTTFYNRYEEREVPLMEVLDPDIGLGYPANINDMVPLPLVDELVIQGQSQIQDGYNLLQSKLFQRALYSSEHNNSEIIFTDDDIKGLNENWNDFPPTIQALFEIVNIDNENNLLHIIACGNTSGANLLGRFVSINKEIDQLVKDITSKEQELLPNVILAEIVHFPEARVGNILSRSHIRNYEILYLSDSDLPKENLFFLSDLMLSVRNGKLFLRSKKLNKEVVPRLTSAHNYNNGSMSAYRFLCDMQLQGRKGLFFMWSQQLQNELSFLPRVRYKNTILSLTTWMVKMDEIKHLFSSQNDEKFRISINEWRKKRNIPRYVLMPDGDNELFVDWENLLSIHSLFSIIKKRESVKFTEFLFSPENGVIKDCENAVYTNEFIVPFYKNNDNEISTKSISARK